MSTVQPVTVRKAAYGRTELFLPSKGTIMKEVKCMGGVVKHGSAHVYHMLPNVLHNTRTCWHCCEDVGETRYPIPRTYDAYQRVYFVFGMVCSPACAKAYIIEHTTFDRGQHLNTLARMMADVYGQPASIVEAPPRPALKRFGGMMDPPPRAMATQCKLVQPPFVSYCMLIEECTHEPPATQSEPPVIETEDLEDAPMEPPLFDAFLVERGRSAPAAAPAPAAKRARPAPKSAPRGALSKYVREADDTSRPGSS